MKQLTLGGFEAAGEQCPTCEQIFETQQGVAAHHWQAHDEKIGVVEVTCDFCGSETTAKRNRVYETNFCGEDCMYAYQTGENHQNYNRDTQPCRFCGDGVTRCVSHFREDGAFCNRDCYADWLRESEGGPEHYLWTRQAVECTHCGDDIWRKQHQLDGRDHFCDYDCYYEWLHINATPPELTTAVRKQLSDCSWSKVSWDFQRENTRKCALCGDLPPKEHFRSDSHHIIPVGAGGTNTDELLMPLCRRCHNKVEDYTWGIPEITRVVAPPAE